MNCVINVGIGFWHPKGSERLRGSLIGANFRGDIKIWNQNIPGCPPHKEVPYAFKAHAFRWAKDRGYISAGGGR